ncbi:Uncharacterised protein [Mycobacteroides abscessus subsp. abscessus]|nr:Uncharacterised protein [Mycobacteroides abscessus subsp. abscessus]
MTSASNHTGAVPDAAARIDAVAERIAADWGHHGHAALTAMITELYTDLAALPSHWSPQQRTQRITDAADTTATQLITLLDDCVYHEADRPPLTADGATLHTSDRHQALTAMLVFLTTWLLATGLAEVLAGDEGDPN